MMNHPAAVLLSGGMDSVAALYWTVQTYPKVLAILFDYGQPNRDQELTAGGLAAKELGVERLMIAVADSLPRGAGILNRVDDHDGREDGTSPAFIPGRNLVFLTCAAAHAAVKWPNGRIDVVIGANAQDAKRFPDCRAGAFAKLSETLRHGVGREIVVVSPWVDRTKEQILRTLDATGQELVSRSWSCYRKSGPCGLCSACVLRRKAFTEAGISDRCVPFQMFGGDPQRDAALAASAPAGELDQGAEHMGAVEFPGGGSPTTEASEVAATTANDATVPSPVRSRNFALSSPAEAPQESGVPSGNVGAQQIKVCPHGKVPGLSDECAECRADWEKRSEKWERFVSNPEAVDIGGGVKVPKT